MLLTVKGRTMTLWMSGDNVTEDIVAELQSPLRVARFVEVSMGTTLETRRPILGTDHEAVMGMDIKHC